MASAACGSASMPMPRCRRRANSAPATGSPAACAADRRAVASRWRPWLASSMAVMRCARGCCCALARCRCRAAMALPASGSRSLSARQASCRSAAAEPSSAARCRICLASAVCASQAHSPNRRACPRRYIASALPNAAAVVQGFDRGVMATFVKRLRSAFDVCLGGFGRGGGFSWRRWGCSSAQTTRREVQAD
jgi:hypothetical protein